MVEFLKDEVAKLEIKQLWLLGKDLTGLGFKELQHLEKQLDEGLSSVRDRKEQKAMLENETLRRQVEELRCLFPISEHVTFLQYQHMERKNSFIDNGFKCNSLACADEKDGDSDITLHLGYYYAFLLPNN